MIDQFAKTTAQKRVNMFRQLKHANLKQPVSANREAAESRIRRRVLAGSEFGIGKLSEDQVLKR